MIVLSMLEIEGKFGSYYDQVTREDATFAQKKQPPPVGGAVYTITYDQDTHTYQATLTTKTQDISEEKLETCLVDFLGGLHALVKDYVKTLCLYSIHKRQDIIFRGQGKYRGKPWRDWAIVDWGKEGKLPCKIWGFVNLAGISQSIRVDYGGIRVKPGMYAVVETAVFTQDEEEINLSEIF